ncbi:MAG: class I SAM-dependent rRNA methyltransferase [Syntrophales bacterium]|nr:class I SAM-dependent rRNA methyltransferase [Syntrophales bacterium]MDD4339562.1 class I SAM-dependent rRNA methyltransferase [Syntrophales bacterium]HOG08271.1 class I SAM-dependent rRNA methyltransferase [Syntrophales bacterium]HOS76556.1 class I SAM-dependent rRNA methyltransferase [Syntrophales bacterium]HPB69504.1 class I SAM-dependent rRNA methyltransferase [Syntrophales bacterium]
MTKKPVYPVVTLKAGREDSLRRGHPWLFSGALARIPEGLDPGEVVTVASASGDALALGFYNPQTDIAVRILTRDCRAGIDAAFWRERLQVALALRRRVVPADTTGYRLINAEGDGVPGLVVDRYDRWLVLSIATAGMDGFREDWVRILEEALAPEGIYERSEGAARRREGLSDRSGVLAGAAMPEVVPMSENGFPFAVDVEAGQKTGFFLDQRPNRELSGRLAAGAGCMLNAFAYSGGFSVYGIRGGAGRVVSVDISERATALAKRNLALNGLSEETHPVLTADVFKYLRETDETFDLVVLDPPAFARSRKDLARAARGYKDINLQAMRRLTAGGLLLTFSCSNPLDQDLFEKIVLGAARDAIRTARVLQRLGPGGDHPTDLGHPEGRYLKGLLLCL